MREFFMTTERLGFSHWAAEDAPLAATLWSDPNVTKFICAHGAFTQEEISAKLKNEMQNLQKTGMQYFPVFELKSGEFVGCCGVHFFDGRFELGYHLRPKFWGNGYAVEAAKAAIALYFSISGNDLLHAGHHPDHKASAHILKKLGFEQVCTVFYEPTGLQHPLYIKKQSSN